jgi:hypothetical protein
MTRIILRRSKPSMGLAPILKMWRLAWWKWARSSLCKKDPSHPDMAEILSKIAELESA